MSAAKKIRKLTVVESAGAPQPLSQAPLYETLFHEANDAIVLVNHDTWKVESVNRRMQDLTGFLADELRGKAVDNLFPRAGQQKKVRSQLLNSDMLSHSGFYEDIAIRRKDGYLAFATLSVRVLTPEQTGQGNLIFCILHDMGEKKSMERDLLTKHWELKNAFLELERAHMELKSAQEALVQAGKLAALGELAAGVAHELNQPLSGILGFSQELESVLKGKGAEALILDHLQEISKNAVRMKKIIQQLREFTRKSVEDFQNTDLVNVIRESMRLLDQQFRSRGIDVRVDSATDLPKVYCNPFQLEQVFINLFTNARDAIEARGGGGHISIQLRRSPADRRFVEIEFRDDGCGMDQEAQKRAFEPFYTTKEVGRGTGLGLSVSYGILSKINGSAVIESEPGKGTTFQIRLPIDYRTLNREKDKES